jgi:hypothetical protein
MAHEAEKSYLSEPDPGLAPEEVFDRRWAACLLEKAFQQLEVEFDSKEQRDRFQILKRFLAEEATDSDCAALAEQLGISAKSVSVAIYRLRNHYRKLVRAEVMATVSNSEMVPNEFQDLFGPGRSSRS